MTKIARTLQKVFGASLTPTGNLAQFGSAANGSPVYSDDPDIIQASTAYSYGFKHSSFLRNGKYLAPFLQDLNGLFYLVTRQLAYIFQQGIAEWSATTTYELHSLAQSGGKVYRSVQATNLNHSVSDTAWWEEYISTERAKATKRFRLTDAEITRALSTFVAPPGTVATTKEFSSICVYAPYSYLYPCGGIFAPSQNEASAINEFSTALRVDPTYQAHNAGGNIAFAIYAESVERFFCCGTNFYKFATSQPNSWTAPTSGGGSSGLWRSMAWSPELKVVVMGAIDTSVIKYSTDLGVTWSDAYPSGGTSHFSICWAPELGKFIAPVLETANVLTSTNGSTWSVQTCPQSGDWKSVCWSPELQLLVMVSSSGTKRVATSRDGVTWVLRDCPEPTNAWSSVDWSPDLGVFFAVASNGTNRGMYSADGINWVACSIGTGSWIQVVWNKYLSCFHMVASARDGSNPSIKSTAFVKAVMP